MNDCIFCKIINKEISSEIIYEDDICIAIKDINPQAPYHILIIPKKHIPTILELNDSEIMKGIFETIKKVSEKLNLKSFRIVNNFGPDALQSIYHVHFHLLAGRKFSWPPG
jgi:histidine triad (HIT) family protein